MSDLQKWSQLADLHSDLGARYVILGADNELLDLLGGVYQNAIQRAQAIDGRDTESNIRRIAFQRLGDAVYSLQNDVLDHRSVINTQIEQLREKA